jgi:hypothetical protein
MAVQKLFTSLLAGSLMTASLASFAEQEIPTTETEFVAQINNYEKARILAQFGEPSMKKDFTTDDGKVFASVWHYHYINTAQDGQYYPTTELDFDGDKVVMVVFMNHDARSADTTIQPAEPAASLPRL